MLTITRDAFTVVNLSAASKTPLRLDEGAFRILAAKAPQPRADVLTDLLDQGIVYL
jgi:hypothetical protein